LNSRSDVILPHKKFTWADFGGINTDIHPRRYAPDFYLDLADAVQLQYVQLIADKTNTDDLYLQF